MGKKKQEKVFRGWLPKETIFSNSFSAKTSPSKRKEYVGYAIIFVGVFATVFLTMSIAYGVGLGSDYATFTAATAGAIASIIVSIMILKPNQKPNQNKPLTEEGKKAAKRIAIANFVMTGVFLGTYFLVNPIIQSVEVTLVLWIVLLAAMFLVNNLLYRKFKKAW